MKLLTNNFTGYLPCSQQRYRIGMRSTNYAVVVDILLDDGEGDFMLEESIIEHIIQDEDNPNNQTYNEARRKALTQIEVSYGIKLIKASLKAA